MELSISRQDLLRALARTHAVADRKSSMPILSNVLITTEGDTVRFAATDLYLGVTTIAKAAIKKQGSTSVSAKTLYDIVKNLPEGEVKWTLLDVHAAEIKCGKARYKIPAMPGEDFPPLPNPGDSAFAELPADHLSALIAHTQYAMSGDDTRPHLAGALLESDAKALRMVTTDGHRLCKAELGGEPAIKFSMLVPHKGIAELKRLIEDAKGDSDAKIGVANASGNAFFRRNGAQLSVKLVDEDFPPYARVIPQKQKRRVVAARTGLIDALRRIILVASDKSSGVRFQFSEGVLRITSENPDVGEGVEELDIDYAGEEVVIGFNARYVLDVLTALVSDEVALELSGALDPGVIRPIGEGVDFVGVIMPMRI